LEIASMRRSCCWIALLALSLPPLLGACTADVRPGKVEVEPTPVRVTIGGGGGGFCPPGQAKKGHC
jgi:hypothetical protein